MSGQVAVQFDRAHLVARLEKAKEYMCAEVAEEILADSRPYTPHDQGALEGSGTVEQIGRDYAVTWNTVYAAYQWYGCWPDGSHVITNHDTSINAQATTQWAEAAKRRYSKDWQIVAQREFVAGAGG